MVGLNRAQFLGIQNWGKGLYFGIRSITTISNAGQRPRDKKDTWRTSRDVSTVRKERKLEEAVHLLDMMKQQGFEAYTGSCASLLQECAKRKALAGGKEVHAHIINSGYEPAIFLGNHLISMYMKCGSLVDARRVFSQMPKRNVISWNAMIAGLAEQGRCEEVFELFQQMQQESVKPNNITFLSILNACASPVHLEQGRMFHASIIKSGLEKDIRVGTALVCMYCRCGSLVDGCSVFYKMPERNLFTFMSILNACASPAALEQGKQLHADIIKAGFESDVRVATALVSMYCKCGSVMDARRVFDNMPKRDMVAWTAMIAGSSHHREEAFKLFQQMKQEGMRVDKVAYIGILKACASPAALEEGKLLHMDIVNAGFESDVRVATALISMYCKCGSVVDARQVFLKMPERNVVSWNAMIGGLAQQVDVEEAIELFMQMEGEGVKPNKVTFISLLNACAIPGALEQGKQVHKGIIKAGFEADVHVGTALVCMYCKCGSLANARQVFFNMPECNVFSWTAMISGTAQHGEAEEAFEYFRQMQQDGIKPDKVAFMSVLNVCATLAALEEGKWVHANSIQSGFESDVCVENALVNMYAKCGSVADARQVFDKILKREAVSWNVMIAGYAQHGLGKEALRLFEEMQEEGVKPNEATFIAILSGCSHVGLVDEGHHYFLLMSGVYNITPTDKHYGCMVDLLGRAGRLDEAEDLINKMPFEPGVPVWWAVLGICRTHGNVVLAERAAENILKLDAHNSAVYVLLSNIYATVGRWEAVAKVRKVMDDRNVRKEPGRSWIEVNKKVHAFVVGDRSHTTHTGNLF